MIFLDELKPLQLYTRPFYLPIVEKNKLKESAVFLLTPSYESSNNLFHNKLFNNKYYTSYYIEKNITYIINQEGCVDLNPDIPYNVLNESSNSTNKISFKKICTMIHMSLKNFKYNYKIQNIKVNYNGKFEEIEPLLLKIIDSCNTIEEIDILKPDLKYLKQELKNMEDFNPENKPAIEKFYKWYSSVYTKALDKKAKEIKNKKISESTIIPINNNIESDIITETYMESNIDGNRILNVFNEGLDEEILNESNTKYNTVIKKILYNERYKNNKEVFTIYNKIKDLNPWIRNSYINYKRYKQLNLLIDLSFYNQTFFKNNIWKMDRGVDLYFDYINRFIKDKRIDKAGYTQKTVLIPILDWAKDDYKIYNFNKEINPISMIYRMMDKNIVKLKNEWKDIQFVFISSNGYFSLDFNTFDKDKVKFKSLLDQLIHKDFVPSTVDDTSEDSKKAIVADIVDKIESSQKVTINNLTGNGNEVTKNELVKKVQKAAVISKTTDDAMDNIDKDDKADDNSFKKLLDTLSDEENDSIKLNAVRKARISKLQSGFLDKKIKDTPIRELLETKDDADLPETSLSIDTVNPEWKSLKFINFEKIYDPQEDILKILNFLSTRSVPVVIRDIKVEDTSTSEDYIDTYDIKCEDANGKRFSLKFDIPKLIDHKFMMLRGNEKTINSQEMLLPVEKTDEDTVQIVSNYNKIFISRFGSSAGKSYVTADKILKTLKKNKNFDFKVLFGDNSKICKKYELPIDYIDLASNISKIENKQIIVYLNQDEIRETYKDIINLNKGIPFAYAKKEKNIIYYNGTGIFSEALFNIIFKMDQNFSDYFNSASVSKKYTYSKASILSNHIPLIVIMGFAEGLTKSMNKANIRYTIEEKRKNNYNPTDVDRIKFKDGYIYYDIDYNSSMLMNGLKECNTEDYSLVEINKRSMYLDFLDLFGGRILADGLDNFYDLMIDPITLEILQHYKLPEDYVSILAYANSLLSDNKYILHTDLSGKRYRSNEIIAGYAYQAIAKSYGDYRNGLRRNRSGVTMTIKQSAVLDAILLDPTASDLSTLNALLDLECTNAVTTKGLSGMNADRSYSLDKRTYDESMQGVLGLSTGFAGNVGITRQAVLDANITGKRGYIKIDKDPNHLNITKAFTATEGLTPFGTTSDDPFRSAMTFIQTCKHGMRTKISMPMLISNGTDQALPYMISNKFAFKAKKNGKVIEKNDDYMVIEYKDGTHDYIDLREVVKKNSDGGFFVTLKLDSDLKQGSSIKENQIVAYDKSSFSDNVGATKDIAYNIGTLTKIALLNNDEGYEDSAIISDYLSDAMSSDVVVMKPVVLPKNTNIFNMVSIGDKVEEGDPLLIFQNAFEDNDVNVLLKNLVDDPKAISDLGRIPVRSKVTGVIQDIKIYRTVEKNELSDSIRKEVNKLEKPLNNLSKVLDKYDIEFKNRYVTDTLDTTGKLKNAKDSVKIEFYIKYHDKMGVGDKLIYYSALKGVTKKIFPKGKEPYSSFRPEEKIHSLLALGSVSARMVCSVKKVGALNKLIIELDRKVKDMAGIKWKYIDEMNL